MTTVRAAAGAVTEQELRLIAATIDVLWGLPTYRRLIDDWGLESADAARSVGWVISLISDAVRDGRGPGSADNDR